MNGSYEAINGNQIILSGHCGFFYQCCSLLLDDYTMLNTVNILLRCRFGMLLSILLITKPLQSQSFEEKDFVHYSTKDGLSNKKVTAITADAYGFIWISSENGLNRFDGYTFKQFYADSSRNTLPIDYIKTLSWMDGNELSSITSSGLHILNTKTLQGRNLVIPAMDSAYEYIVNNVHAAIGDKKGNKFLLTGSGFYHFNMYDQLVFRYDHQGKNKTSFSSVPFGRTNGICKPESDIILIATTNGPYIYTISKRILRPLSKTDSPFYSKIKQSDINMRFMHHNDSSFSVQLEDAVELSYFDTRSKLKLIIHSPFNSTEKFNWRSQLVRINDSTFAITGKEKGFYLVHKNNATKELNILPELYFPNHLCTSMFVDKNNRLWIGTNKGVFLQRKQNGHIERIDFAPFMNPFKKDVHTNMVTIANHKIFVASNGEGLLVFDQNSGRSLAKIDFLRYATMGNYVISTVSLNNDTLLAGIGGALLWVNTGNYKHEQIILPHWNNNENWVASMFKDSRNNIYVCPNRENEFYLKSKNGKFERKRYPLQSLFNILVPRYMSEDNDGNIWFAGHGLSRFNKHLQQFDKRLASFPKIKFARLESTQPQFDKHGRLYVAIKNNGLIIYDTYQNKFEQITRTNGLPDNDIKAIYLHNNTLWIGTPSGLASMDINSRQVSSFGITDDFPDEPFTAYHFFYDSIQQKLYAGFNNSIVRFNPDSLKKNTFPPSLFIESISISGNNTIYHPKDSLQLSYRQNNLVLQLAAINFEDAYQQQFAYRIVKQGNEAWQNLGRHQQIVLSDLPAGNYTLQAKAYILNNSWPEQIQTLSLYIQPPFWQTKWFWILIALSTSASLYLVYRIRIKNIHQKANIDKQLAELEIKGLHAQMNPHFIFNALNSIKEMILEDEKKNASRYLSKFALLIRTTLNHSTKTFISVKQCIDHLQQYLEMEKIRFHDFEYSISVSNEIIAEETLIAPMLLQPLVENAIWHGLRNKEGNKKLNIRFLLQYNQLVCEIEDNGIGINQSTRNKSRVPETHGSLGIKNIRDRLTILNEKYKMNCSLEILDKAGENSGTMAVLRLTI